MSDYSLFSGAQKTPSIILVCIIIHSTRLYKISDINESNVYMYSKQKNASKIHPLRRHPEKSPKGCPVDDNAEIVIRDL